MGWYCEAAKLGAGVALVLIAAGGRAPAGEPAPTSYGRVVPVTIRGYHGDAMEPFVSPDGKYLFFNNRNDPATNTDLFFARRVNDSTFNYGGEIRGVNGSALDAVPSMDTANEFFFVSTRSYTESLSTIYRGTFAAGVVSRVSLLSGVSSKTPRSVNFDADVSADGKTMYLVDGRFDHSGQPTSANLVIAKKTATGYRRLANSAQILANVNTSALEYGAAVSNDGRVLFFTRARAPLGSTAPAIYVATRSSETATFGAPRRLAALTGFVEAPALSPDGRSLYFHKLVDDTFVICRASKPLTE